MTKKAFQIVSTYHINTNVRLKNTQKFIIATIVKKNHAQETEINQNASDPWYLVY